MTILPRRIAASVDQRVELALDWARFEDFLTLRGDSNATRIAYLDGRLEIMSPSESHEAIKKRLARLLEAWAEHHDIDMDGVGSWTVKDSNVEAGGEADECYLIPGREGATRPDLAIEVNWSTTGLDKLEVWRRLQVPEVWIHEDGRLRVFALDREGAYQEHDTSRLLPGLDLGMLAQFATMRNQLLALKAFRAVWR